MKKNKFESAIVELKRILGDMKALLEWHKLKRFEAAKNAFPNLMFHDTTLIDWNNKYSTFLLLASKIHAKIDNQNISQTIKKELVKLELQAFYLGSHVRIY